jgi:membrane protease YdiL (CAAX protease family)
VLTSHTQALSGASTHVRLVFFWAAVGSLTSALAVPYEVDFFSAKIPASHIPLPLLFFLQAAQVLVLLIVAVWVGLRAGSKVGLGSPFARSLVYGLTCQPWSTKRLGISAALGAAIGVAMHLELSGTPKTVPWKGLLLAFYAGITEELLFRLFAMSVLVWIGWRVLERTRPMPSSAIYWTANIVAALLFGAAHLGGAASVWSLTPALVARVILVNAGGGVVFGTIFWWWGLEYAMVSHFLTDVVLHALIPLI